jgi:hypothetical protein
VAAAIYPVTQPTTLDEYEAAIERIAAEGVEPARSAALDTLSRQIRSSAWNGFALGRAHELAGRAHGLIDRDQDLLRGSRTLVTQGALVLERRR